MLKRVVKHKKILILTVVSLLIIAGLGYIYWPARPAKSEVITKSEDISNQQYQVSLDTISDGQKQAKIFQGNSNFSVESGEVNIQDQPNALVLGWEIEGRDTLAEPYVQNNQSELVNIEVSIKDNGRWKDWQKIEFDDPGGGNSTNQRKALIMGNAISDFKYRFNIRVDPDTAKTPTLKLNQASLETIDTKKGPSLELSLRDKIKGALSLKIDQASAASSPPRIISRAEWGSPEPNSSEWDREYRPITRAYLHHTATAANSSDTASSVRAIWQYHAKTLGWGDIGYNYLVDIHGNIFQGRLTDENYAKENQVDVVGGHAYGANYGSVGVSAMGNFMYETPSAGMLESIANVFAFKLAKYNLDPTGWYGNLPVLIAHRDTHPTACPGNNMYTRLGDIRNRAAQLVGYYKPYYDSLKKDYVVTNVIDPKKFLYAGETTSAVIKIKNVSQQIWYPDGSVPSGKHPTRLATYNYTGSIMADTISEAWLGTASQVRMLGTAQVNPGEIASFKLDFKSPDPALTVNYDLGFSVVEDGVRLLKGNKPISFTFTPPTKLKVKSIDYINKTIISGSTLADLSFSFSPDVAYPYELSLDSGYGIGSKLSLSGASLIANQSIQPGQYQVRIKTTYRGLYVWQILDINVVPDGYTPIYRFWSPTYNHHFYTASAAERDDVISKYPGIWNYEQVAWYALSLLSGSCPNGYEAVYRFWSPKLNGHFYTASNSEKNYVISTWPDTWSYEGPQYCVQANQAASSNKAVYRFWSPKLNGHFYTASNSEKNYVISTWPDTWS